MKDELFEAIRKEDLISVKQILDKDRSLLNQIDERGSTPLLLASYLGFEEMTDYLLSLRPDLDVQDASGNTALMGVCFKGHTEIARKLLQAGVNPNLKNTMGDTAISFAKMFQKDEIVTLLEEFS